MAEYITTVKASGSYNSTAGGCQIGGNDKSDASVTIKLPDNYSSYDSCSIVFTFYAAYDPDDWDSSWSSYNPTVIPVYLKVTGSLSSNTQIWNLEASELKNYSDSNKHCTFTIDFKNDLQFPISKPGDTFKFTFDGEDGMFINSSEGKCLYLVEATFTSTNAVLVSQKKYLLVKSYTATSVSSFTSGTYYVTWSDYKKHWGYSEDPRDYMAITLDGNGNGYYSDITYYTASQQYLTDSSGNRLYIPD